VKRFGLMLIALAACGGKAKPTLTSLAPGNRVALSVAQAPSGLSAVAVLAEAPEAADDPGGVDCQNGLDPAGKPCDGGPAANPNDGSPDTAKATPSQIVVPRAALQGSAQSTYTALGLSIVSAAAPSTGAAVRFLGGLDASGRFVATGAHASRSTSGRLVGTLQSVARTPNGVSFKLLGQSVEVASAVPFAVVPSVEAAAAQDLDGVTCEQNGQQQGDNASCAAAPAGT
jgi:hypothetical protein